MSLYVKQVLSLIPLYRCQLRTTCCMYLY